VGGTAGAGDENPQAPFLGGAGVGDEAKRGAMGADDADFGRDSCFAEKGVGGLEGRPVGPTTHDDADERARAFQEVRLLPSGLK
jgi:hypothetical protein